MRSVVTAILGIALPIFFTMPLALRAQATTGTIYGTVVDESKSVLPGVSVQVKNVENGAARALVTDANGHYRALSLPPGLYSVAADLPGFTTAKREHLIVEIGRDVVADLTMTVGGISEQVVVQGAATNVELSSAVAGGVVSTTQIAELPLNGRSFMQLATLQPSSASTPSKSSASRPTTTARSSGARRAASSARSPSRAPTASTGRSSSSCATASSTRRTSSIRSTRRLAGRSTRRSRGISSAGPPAVRLSRTSCSTSAATKGCARICR